MNKKRYTVTSIQTSRGPEYVIEDTVLGAYVGFFDTQKWAESIAGVMEEQWKEKYEQDKIRFGNGEVDSRQGTE